MGRFLETVLDLLFPRRCPLCAKISDGVCEECAKKLPYVRQPICFRCGKPLPNEEQEYCQACNTYRYAYEQGRALYLYVDPVRESLHAVKYQNKREYLEFYAQDMAEHFEAAISSWRPQVILSIPMHRAAKRRRGYNQSQILAEHLGKQLGIPVCADGLKKIKKTANQKELHYRARRINLTGAFAVNEKYLQGADGKLSWQRILLVDDIYTTGSTIQEASKILRAAGAGKVYFVTLCIVPENS